MNSALKNIPRAAWYNPTGYQSNIDLSGGPLPTGVTNLSDEPIVGQHGAGHSALSPTGNMHQPHADRYLTFKRHVVTGSLNKSFI